MHVLNPFDLNLTRAYSAPDAFCPRPDLEKGESGPAHRALRKLIELELLREEQCDGRRRVWVHDARPAFYLGA
jgi:hypothetical protein